MGRRWHNFKCNKCKKIENKEVHQISDRNKTQVEIEKIQVVNDTETVKIEGDKKLIEVEPINGKVEKDNNSDKKVVDGIEATETFMFLILNRYISV